MQISLYTVAIFDHITVYTQTQFLMNQFIHTSCKWMA